MKLSLITGTQEPEGTDPPAGHLQMTSLVDNLERFVIGRFADRTALAAAIPTPTAGMRAWLTTEGPVVYRNSAWIGVPLGVLGQIAQTVPSGYFTVEAPLPQYQLTVTVLAQRYIRVAANLTIVQSNAPSMQRITIKEGSTYVAVCMGDSGQNQYNNREINAILKPTAGTHTYIVYGITDAGQARCEPIYAPSYMYVEDLGGY